MNRVDKWSAAHVFCLIWGVGGVVGLLLHAIWRISPVALQLVSYEAFGIIHWAALILWVGFMAYTEGYKGFQLAFSPRVVARAIYLGNHPSFLRIALAPVICMGLLYATRKRLIVSWLLLVGIVCLIVAIQYLAQPWRGIVDVGVIVGLGWGLCSLLWFMLRAFFGTIPQINPDVPATVQTAV